MRLVKKGNEIRHEMCGMLPNGDELFERTLKRAGMGRRLASILLSSSIH